MTKHDMKDYIKRKSGKYLLVNSIARRVRDLQNGYKPLIARPSSDFATVATEEFAQDKMDVTTRDAETADSTEE